MQFEETFSEPFRSVNKKVSDGTDLFQNLK